MGLFVSYKEKTVTNTAFTTLNFLYNLQMAQYARLARYKHSSLMGQFVSNEEKSIMNTVPGTVFTTLTFLHDLQMAQ
jgi:hypothetical protein